MGDFRDFFLQTFIRYRGDTISAEIGRPGACGKKMSLQRMFHMRHNALSYGPMSVRET